MNKFDKTLKSFCSSINVTSRNSRVTFFQNKCVIYFFVLTAKKNLMIVVVSQGHSLGIISLFLSYYSINMRKIKIDRLHR